jgi:hypothetical protein
MASRRTGWSFLVATGFLLAACGGGGTPAATDAGGGTSATTAPEATSEVTAPAEATTAPTDAAGGGGSGAAGDFAGKMCDLITLDEMNAVTMIAADSQDEQPFVAGSGTCGFNGGGVPVGAVTLIGGSTTDATVPFGIYKSDASSEAFPVNGGEGLWYGNATTAMVLKNGYLGSILILAPKDGDMKAAATSLLQTLADRMP